jgi:hypothetical protein
MLGPMSGGCYVALPTPTLRQLLGCSGAIPLHDRFETPEQYRSLST